MKDLEIKTSIVIYLVFASNTTLSCFFLFFLIIDSKILISEAIAQIFNSTAQLTMPIAIPTKETKEETETHSVTTKAKISKCSIKFKLVQTFMCLLIAN